MEPPHDLYIEVRCLKNIGKIITVEGETINLSKNTLHYLKRSDVFFKFYFIFL